MAFEMLQTVTWFRERDQASTGCCPEKAAMPVGKGGPELAPPDDRRTMSLNDYKAECRQP
jgi:hypothetical protein